MSELVRRFPKLMAVVAGTLMLMTVCVLGAAHPTRPANLFEQGTDTPAAVAELFRALARPLDQVKLASGEVVRIEPASADTLLDLPFTGSVVTQTLAEGDAPSQPLVLTSAGVVAYVPYESQVLEHIAAFNKAAAELPALQRLTALETALSATLRFSLGFRDRPLKNGNRWEPLQAELDRKLLDVRLALLRLRAAATRTAKDLGYGNEMVGWYPGNGVVVTEAARQRTNYATYLLLHVSANPNAKVYADIRTQLEWLEEHLPQPPRPAALEVFGDTMLQASQPFLFQYQPDAHAVRQLLIHKANTLRAEASQTKDDKAAIKLLEAAEKIWPRLPGLRDDLLKRQGNYAILNVGVRSLPVHLSPAGAVSDSELQSLELLFEGLLQARPEADGTQSYAPQIATALPRMASNERHFVLKKNAYWSNGTRVSAADVQNTFEWLISPKRQGRDGEFSDRIEQFRMDGDHLRVEAKLRKGMLDPLAPFTFKVLPREYTAAANHDAFDLAPVGSGPYMLAGKITEHGRTYVRFVVNPYHASRRGADGPRIREIRFFVASDPLADLSHKTAAAQLLLDVPAAAAAKLQVAGFKQIQLRPRRVFFLAVNHRRAVLADPALRRALAHALNRRQLVNDCFAGGQPLNGPYPAGSWAVCADERVPADLLDRTSAASYLKAAKGEAFDVELKYPEDDPGIDKACKEIAAQWAELGDQAERPIKVRLVPLSMHQLQLDLQTRNYQLVYWRYDFPDNAFSLWPLFDPRPQAVSTGSNYLGFKDDDVWTELLNKAGSYRDFAEVKRLTHDIHVAFHERMPLIPLWQLDYHIAFQPSVTMPLVDPLRVFGNLDEWQVGGR